jgi:putrescine aminotransferase
MLEKVKELAMKDRLHYLHPTTSIREHYEKGPSLIIDRGEGVYLYDISGKRYIDGMSSLWNVNVGHGRRELAEAAMSQMLKLAYSHSFNNFSHEPVVRLSERLAGLTPGELDVFFYTSGGSEANDTAFKLIRHYFRLKGQPERFKIIARKRAYHGISLGATSATGMDVYRHMAPPLSPGFLHGPAPHCYRCEFHETYPSCNLRCAVDGFRQIIEAEGPETVAAIMVEPVQGAGGVIVPPSGYMKALRELCDEYGILLCTDEVITGFGRTGRWFGVEHEGVIPDVMTFAKGITSGYFPLGGVAISKRMHEEMASLSNGVMPHGFTYSGHPTGCAVALANLEIIEREHLVENADRMGALLKQRLQELKTLSPLVGNVMCRGLLASVEIVKDKSTKEPFPPEAAMASKIFKGCLERGVIVRPLAIDGTDIIAMAPPLIINEEQVNTMIDALADALAEGVKCFV